MPDEFVQAKWARAAVKSIERAIGEWTNQHPTNVSATRGVGGGSHEPLSGGLSE
jgi:hypothetical protein